MGEPGYFARLPKAVRTARLNPSDKDHAVLDRRSASSRLEISM